VKSGPGISFNIKTLVINIIWCIVNITFLHFCYANLDQRSIWAIAIFWCTLSINLSTFDISSGNTGQSLPNLARRVVRWSSLKIIFFHIVLDIILWPTMYISLWWYSHASPNTICNGHDGSSDLEVLLVKFP